MDQVQTCSGVRLYSFKSCSFLLASCSASNTGGAFSSSFPGGALTLAKFRVEVKDRIFKVIKGSGIITSFSDLLEM